MRTLSDRYRLWVPVVLAGWLVVAPAAPAKEGVRATLDDPAALARAKPGARIAVAWTLNAEPWLPLSDPAVRAPHPFGASGVYLSVGGGRGGVRRIVSARPPAGARGYPEGRYVADVTIPAGGIDSIAIGLEGYRHVTGRDPVRADLFFPIDNDPFVAARAPGGGGDSPAGAAIVALAAILMLPAGYGAIRARRRAMHA